MRDLNEQQQKFVLAYSSNGGNATAAAKTAGYSAATAGVQGGQLLRKPHVLRAVQDAQRDALRTCGTAAIETLRGLMRHSKSERIRLGAAVSILDRAGLTAKAAEEANAAQRAKPISEMSADELASLIAVNQATVAALEFKMLAASHDAPADAGAALKVVN